MPLQIPNVDLDVKTSNSTDELRGKEKPVSSQFEATAKSLCLAVCYSATCGGVATLAGTGTNLIFYDNALQ